MKAGKRSEVKGGARAPLGISGDFISEIKQIPTNSTFIRPLILLYFILFLIKTCCHVIIRNRLTNTLIYFILIKFLFNLDFFLTKPCVTTVN